MEKKIEVKNLNKIFYMFDKDYKILQWIVTKKGCSKEKHVLKNISFSVDAGEIVGLIGVNGAGKSTLMKLVAGITYPSSGEVTVNGRVGALINLSAGFNPDYTGRKNIYYKGTLMGMSRTEIDHIIDDIEEFVELGEYFDRPIRMYSSGMSARLGFALAVYTEPEILIIDEVLAVGDKIFQKKSRAKVEEMFQQGKSVLFSSHSDDLIRQFCSRVLYLKDGEIVFDGDVEEGLKLYNEDIKKKK
ncbi:MAG: ABC transporter ATP-binding protein [Lachnospiraceae bacterium]|nr:ABC transporter ATP-binding protein [Lachnospiraceae bacterium]